MRIGKRLGVSYHQRSRHGTGTFQYSDMRAVAGRLKNLNHDGSQARRILGYKDPINVIPCRLRAFRNLRFERPSTEKSTTDEARRN